MNTFQVFYRRIFILCVFVNTLFLSSSLLFALSPIEYTYYYWINTDSVCYKEEFKDDCREIVNADVESFERYNASFYAHDKNAVYFRGEKVLNADAESLKTYYKTSLYASDKDFVYFRGKKVVDLDVDSFKAYGQSLYAYDKDSVYFGGEKIEGVDVNSFEYSSLYFYLKDKNAVYFWGKRLESADRDSLENLGMAYNFDYYLYVKEEGTLENTSLPPGRYYYLYAKDKDHVFYNGEEIPEADPSSFEFLHADSNSNYAKDQYHGYYKGESISNEPDSFALIEPKKGVYRGINDFKYAKDKNHVFYEGDVIKQADSRSFRYHWIHEIDPTRDNSSFFLDKNALYYEGERYPRGEYFTDSIGENFVAIQWLKSKNIVQGYQDNKFHPSQKIDRAEFLKILIATLSVEISDYKNCFPDVTTQWFAPYICFAKERGVVKGFADGNFYPEKNVTLAEAAKMTVLLFDYDISDQEPYSTDTSRLKYHLVRDSWFYPYVITIKDMQAMLWSFRDFTQDITRGEMAEMIWRLQEKPYG